MTVDLTYGSGTYRDGPPPGTGDFTLNGAPAGTTIDSVVRNSATQATLTLAFDGTDFTSNTSLSVTVAHTALATGTGPATTGTVPVSAENPFGYRKKITIDRSKIPTGCGATLLNYPVLVSLTDVNLRTKASDATNGRVENANGYDIIFRAEDTATCGGAAICTLDHEIEKYTASTGALVAWVRLPSVKTADGTNTTDIEIYVYYGNSDITSSTENVDSVWDINFVGVWHLNESGDGTVGEFVDSSGATHHGQGQGGVPNQNIMNGQIGNAQDFDGTLNYIKIPYAATLAPANFTISLWRKADVVEQSATFKSAAGDGYNSGYATYGDGTTINLRWGTGSANDGGHFLSGTQTVWTYTTGTYDGSTMDFYLDGGATSGQDASPTFGYSGTDDAKIGYVNGIEEFDGLIDEVRISDTPRSTCWIAADYNNQKWPDKDDHGASGFFTVGGEESPLTAVELIAFMATAYDRAVLLEWRTGYEVDNLGFHVYRELEGERLRLTRSLIAGSGLLTERGAGVTSVQGYAWWDHEATVATPALAYWLEDVDFDGTSTFHGPVTPVAGGHLIDVGPPDVDEGVAGENSLGLSGLADARGARRLAFLTGDRPPSVTRRVAPGVSGTPREAQWALAGQAAVKLGVRRTGWFRVTQGELVAAGLDPEVDPRTLRVFVGGVEQAIIVSGEADGRFDPADAIGFYGRGVDTAYTDTRVYWVVAGAERGLRVGAPTPPAPPRRRAARPPAPAAATVTTPSPARQVPPRVVQPTRAPVRAHDGVAIARTGAASAGAPVAAPTDTPDPVPAPPAEAPVTDAPALESSAAVEAPVDTGPAPASETAPAPSTPATRPALTITWPTRVAAEARAPRGNGTGDPPSPEWTDPPSFESTEPPSPEWTDPPSSESTEPPRPASSEPPSVESLRAPAIERQIERAREAGVPEELIQKVLAEFDRDGHPPAVAALAVETQAELAREAGVPEGRISEILAAFDPDGSPDDHTSIAEALRTARESVTEPAAPVAPPAPADTSPPAAGRR